MRACVRACVCVCVCVCVKRPGARTEILHCRGTQHFTGTVSNEATSEVGYPAWPAGRTCNLSFLIPFAVPVCRCCFLFGVDVVTCCSAFAFKHFY